MSDLVNKKKEVVFLLEKYISTIEKSDITIPFWEGGLTTFISALQKCITDIKRDCVSPTGFYYPCINLKYFHPKSPLGDVFEITYSHSKELKEMFDLVNSKCKEIAELDN
ncbi:hypothetical protein [Motilimonas pumila]|uniref:Uncharacterized protein n=1 Tax=Motilimonas pumila TaxID=2303987 RepID=A0A418YG05_9GAMM|nr:hypothetical protein [Motilimonas pumila]RJG48419.1 hypothetical protein D1Z90_07960 [Motilimonas pumila]